MRHTRYIVLVFFPSLLMIILTGCERRDILNNYPVSGVDIKLEWSGVGNELPDGMRVIFYPKDTEGRKVDAYLPVKGGEVKVPPGRYSMVIYNYNTETVQIRNEETYETIEAFTGYCTGLGITGTEEMVWEPDPLYVISVEDIYIKKSDQKTLLNYKPQLVVRSYSFSAEVEGLQYVKNIVGYVEGMADCYRLGTGKKCSSDSPIYFELSRTDNMIKGCFCCYGSTSTSMTRAEGLLKLTLAFVKVDNSVQKLEMDITEVIQRADEIQVPGAEEETQPQIELPIQDDGIVVEEPTSPPIGGGGIGGDVGDWGEEDNVELPVK